MSMRRLLATVFAVVALSGCGTHFQASRALALGGVKGCSDFLQQSEGYSKSEAVGECRAIAKHQQQSAQQAQWEYEIDTAVATERARYNAGLY